jgi:hypothetical protein
VERSGGSDEVRSARREQGTLIASGLMAGAAVIGILSAVLRLPEVGAPIRKLSVGARFFYERSERGAQLLKSKARPWFEGFPGQLAGLCAFGALGLLCFLLARKGAQWELADKEEK